MSVTGRAALLGVVAAGLWTACAAHDDIKDPDPAVKIPAMKRAAAVGDRRQLGELVKDLQSDDPAVRMYAINTLERLTGSRNGYEYYDDDASREKAVARWQAWLTEQSGPAPQPTTKTESAAK